MLTKGTIMVMTYNYGHERYVHIDKRNDYGNERYDYGNDRYDYSNERYILKQPNCTKKGEIFFSFI